MSNIFLREIREQPEVLRVNLDLYSGEEGKVLREARALYEVGCRNVVFTGMGSSFFVGYTACGYLNGRGIPAFTVEAGELLHYNLGCISEDTLVVAVSQSGESIEVRRIIEELGRRRDKIRILGVTNNQSSFVAENCDLTLLTHCGEERATSSKTYVATLEVLLFLADALAGGSIEDKYEEFDALIGYHSELLDRWGEIAEPMLKFLGDIPYINLIGRGPSLSSALQGALILKEAANVYAEGISGGGYRHGPMELARENYRAAVFAPRGETSALNLRLAKEIADFGGLTLLITNEDVKASSRNLHIVKLKAVDEYLSPLLEILPMEMLACTIAEKKGIKPWSFSRISKTTTRE
ncbi:MAG: SIS domain-containing protein [bacterium]